MWQSKLQTETALSTMEAEIIALAACMRALILIIDMVQSLAVSVGRPAGDVNMKVSVHEDDSGALVLAETLPPQFTPCGKYFAIKVIWFQEENNKRGVTLSKVDTKEQLGDIFTKGLAYFSVGRCPSFRRYPKCKDCLGMKQKASIVRLRIICRS
jgi:hypothetical protein